MKKKQDDNQLITVLKLMVEFSTFTIFAFILMYSIVKYNFDVKDLNCYNGDFRCHTHCKKQDNLDNSCIKQYLNDNTSLEDTEWTSICKKFNYGQNLNKICWKNFLISKGMKLADGILNDNLCQYQSNGYVKCLNQKTLESITKYKYKNVKKLSMSEVQQAGIQGENKLFHNIDFNLNYTKKTINFPKKVVDEIENASLTDIKLSDKRLCVKDQENKVTCSGNYLNSNHLQAGGRNKCMIKSSGNSLWCSGEVEEITSNMPPELAQDTLAVAVGHFHACAISKLTDENTIPLHCWGQNQYGQLDLPYDEKLYQNITNVSAGFSLTCVTQESMGLKCWGDAHPEETQDQQPPEHLTHLVLSVSLGLQHGCVLQMNEMQKDQAGCWGNNQHGQTSTPTQKQNATQVTAGDFHTCLMLKDMGVVCFGLNDQGQTKLPSLINGKLVLAGDRHTCGLDSNQGLVCGGMQTQSSMPDKFSEGVLALAVGSNSICVVEEQGKFFCWDAHDKGLGNTNTHQLGITQQSYTFHNVDKFDLVDTTIAFTNTKNDDLTFADLGSMEQQKSLNTSLDFCTGSKLKCQIKQVRGIKDSHEFTCENSSKSGVSVQKNQLQKDISCGYQHGCVLWMNGEVDCIGGTEEQREALIPDEMKFNVQKVKAGKNVTCVLNDNYKINCFGKTIKNQQQRFNLDQLYE